MRNIVLGIVLFFVFILLSLAIYLYFFTKLTPVKFSSLHPNIQIVNSSSRFFDIYSNLVLNIKNTAIWNVKPSVMGIFYTDKIRPDNQVIKDDYLQALGATIDIVNKNEVLIYIYVSDDIINSDSPNKIIKDYTIKTIRYYQGIGKSNIDNIFSNLIKLPLYVKSN